MRWVRRASRWPRTYALEGEGERGGGGVGSGTGWNIAVCLRSTEFPRLGFAPWCSQISLPTAGLLGHTPAGAPADVPEPLWCGDRMCCHCQRPFCSVGREGGRGRWGGMAATHPHNAHPSGGAWQRHSVVTRWKPCAWGAEQLTGGAKVRGRSFPQGRLRGKGLFFRKLAKFFSGELSGGGGQKSRPPTGQRHPWQAKTPARARTVHPKTLVYATNKV